MKLTESQRASVMFDDNTFLTACPGSGKTRALIAKLLRCLEEVRDTARHIACITYTNAGVYEIENRLRAFGKTGDEFFCEISTIHSFCLNNILRYFYWRLPEYANGFVILPTDSDKYRDIVISICDDYGLGPREYDCFELLNREPDGTPIVQEPLTKEIAMDFWNRLQQNSYIDFPNIVYFSYRLMSLWASITHAISCRFSWILVDEFQDTTALQVDILKMIDGKKRTKFFLVGDPYQSIYGFAGAQPNLMQEFAEKINARSDFSLSTNFRSSEAIVSHAERLCPRCPGMVAEGNYAHFNMQPQYINSQSTFEAIVDYFIPTLDELGIEYGEAAILAPWWIKLLHLGRELRNYGIPIIGPGARPYKRNHLFALLAEQICAYINDPAANLIPQIERELFILLNNITKTTNFRVFTYNGRVTVYKLIKSGIELSIRNDSALIWLEKAAEEFSEILYTNEFLPRACMHLLTESVHDMQNDMRKQLKVIDIANLSVTDLGIFASTRKNMNLRTIHRAKGLEFEAVAIIDIHKGKIPHYSASTQDEIEEGRRLLYVAITRAKRVLMYITDSEDPRNEPSIFLYKNGLGIINRPFGNIAAR